MFATLQAHKINYDYNEGKERVYFSWKGNYYTIDMKAETIKAQSTYSNNTEITYTVNELKRTYSTIALKTIAKKKKWTIRKTRNSYQLVKY